MALKIGDNFSYQANKPNFERDSFTTLAAMKAYPETSIDDGHISYCAETDKHYKFLSTNIVDVTTGKWREFETGSLLPEEGTAGQVLTKTEEGYEWQDPKATFPEGGTAGQVLKKTPSGVEWGTDEKGFELPSGGSNGQVLKKSGSTVIWQDDNNTTYENATQSTAGLMSSADKTKLDNLVEIPNEGTEGQVLKKTSTGVEWTNDNDTTYDKATQQADGLMSKEDKTKLDNITTAYASIMTQAEYDKLSLKEENRIYYIKG